MAGKVVQIPGVGNVEFPEGMSDEDIAVAAKKAYDAAPTEPGTKLGGMAKGFKEGVTGGAKGFAEGVIPGLLAGAKGVVTAPIGLIKEAISTVGGTANLMKDPEGTLQKAYDAIKGSGSEAVHAVKGALDLARNDPEAFGQLMGNLTGQAEVGVATAKLVPTALKPVAGKLGRTMEVVGTKGQWPIRMMGAHQLGSGNPMGIATMMVPEGLKQGGAALQEYAGSTNVTPRLVGSETLPSRQVSTGGMRMAPGKEGAVASTVEKTLGRDLAATQPTRRPSIPDLDASIAQAAKESAAKRGLAAKSASQMTTAEQKADLDALRGKRFIDQAPETDEQVIARMTGRTNQIAPKSGATVDLTSPAERAKTAASLNRAGLSGGVRLAGPPAADAELDANASPGSYGHILPAQRGNFPHELAPPPVPESAFTNVRPVPAAVTPRYKDPLTGNRMVDVPGGSTISEAEATKRGLTVPKGGAMPSEAATRAARDAAQARLAASTPASSYTAETGFVSRPNPLNLTSSGGGGADVNPISAEMMYRELSRKPVITPDDAITLKTLKDLIERRASEVGMSYASGGKAGPSISPSEE